LAATEKRELAEAAAISDHKRELTRERVRRFRERNAPLSYSPYPSQMILSDHLFEAARDKGKRPLPNDWSPVGNGPFLAGHRACFHV